MSTFAPQEWVTRSGKRVVFRICDPDRPGDVDAFLVFQPQAASETQHTLQVVGRVPERAKIQAAWQENLRDPIALRVGVFAGDRMVAQLGFYAENPTRHPWVEHVGRFGMMVLKEFWGEGVGRKLLELMETHARTVGITRIEALVRTANDRGLRLYAREGYRIEGTRKRAALIDGEYRDEYFIAKLLDEPGQDWKPPVLETARMVLRPIELSDAPGIFEYARNPNVSRYTLWEPHLSLKDSEAYVLDYAFPRYREQVPEPWAIALKSTPGRIIGTVGLSWASKTASSMELAYAIAEEHWGKALVAEAARAAIGHAFAHLGAVRVQAHYKAENEASGRVMQKIGMKHEGCYRSAVFHRGRHWDMIVYSILREGQR
jgi:ribosomal-protein-alanine N-acetyltransferase